MNATVTLFIDDEEATVDASSSVKDACEFVGKEIPSLCSHNRLSIDDNCKMCVVEIEGKKGPVTSCSLQVEKGMRVHTNTSAINEFRKKRMAELLEKHPLDCFVCDKAGECDLQDLAVAYGSDRSVKKSDAKCELLSGVDISCKIHIEMSRCIKCKRCISFAKEIAGVEEIGTRGRNLSKLIKTYVEEASKMELSGNMVDLCPVGAINDRLFSCTARSWELERTSSIDVMDGAGSNICIDHRNGNIKRIVARENNDINEEWITDKARFSWDGLANNRLTSPMVKKRRKLCEVDWEEALKKVALVVKGKSRDKIAALAGDVHSAEDYYSFKAFITKILGSDNIDARSDGSQINGSVPAAYVMHTTVSRIEEADAVLLVGINPRWEASVLDVKLRRLAANGVPIGVIGPEIDTVYSTQNLGNSPMVLEKLLDGKSAFAKILQKAQKPIVIVGSGVLSRWDGEQVVYHAGMLAEQLGIVEGEWKGFNVVQRSAGRVAALDMGVHPTAGGFSTRDILGAISREQVDVLFIYGDVEISIEQLKGAKKIVYIGTHFTEQARLADIILPVSAYSEKAGLWTNIEGRVQEGFPAINAIGEAKEDWRVFRALSEKISKEPLPFNTLGQLRNLIVEYCPAYGKIGQVVPPEWEHPGVPDQMDDAPFVLPVTKENFYRTNEILRASCMMEQCSLEVEEK